MEIVRVGLALALATVAVAETRRRQPASSLEQFILQAGEEGQPAAELTSPGSLFTSGARMTDLARDPKAGRLHDLVTIVVSDRASAVAKGVTNTARKSDVSFSVGAVGGLTRAAGPLKNLAQATGEMQLQGQGLTSRENTLSTTLAARVTHVLPNGDLVLEGAKDIEVNAERQTITIRGVARPSDLTPANQVRSDRLAFLEVRVNGKGVVGDSIRRPFFLYRLLMGILPL